MFLAACCCRALFECAAGGGSAQARLAAQGDRKAGVRGPLALDIAQRRRKSDGLMPNFLRNAVLKCDELLKPHWYATSVTDSGRGSVRISRS
jgi:hypothetical protein